MITQAFIYWPYLVLPHVARSGVKRKRNVKL